MGSAILPAKAAGGSVVLFLAARTPGTTIGGTIALSLKGWTFGVNRDFFNRAAIQASRHLPIAGCS